MIGLKLPERANAKRYFTFKKGKDYLEPLSLLPNSVHIDTLLASMLHYSNLILNFSGCMGW
jgi:hypothetical protein